MFININYKKIYFKKIQQQQQKGINFEKKTTIILFKKDNHIRILNGK